MCHIYCTHSTPIVPPAPPVTLLAVCLAGYAGANCAACPRGTYRATDQPASATLTCSNCTEGSTTPTTASTSAAQCTGNIHLCRVCYQSTYAAPLDPGVASCRMLPRPVQQRFLTIPARLKLVRLLPVSVAWSCLSPTPAQFFVGPCQSSGLLMPVAI